MISLRVLVVSNVSSTFSAGYLSICGPSLFLDPLCRLGLVSHPVALYAVPGYFIVPHRKLKSIVIKAKLGMVLFELDTKEPNFQSVLIVFNLSLLPCFPSRGFIRNILLVIELLVTIVVSLIVRVTILLIIDLVLLSVNVRQDCCLKFASVNAPILLSSGAQSSHLIC